MKHKSAGLVAAGVLLAGLVLQAQDEQPPRPGADGAPQPAMHEGRRGATGRPAPGVAAAIGMQGILADRILNDPEIAAKLGLTEEQVTKLKEKLLPLKQAEAKLSSEMETAAIEQARLMTADKVSEADVMAAVEKVGGLRTQVAKVQAQKMLALRQGLTADQMKKIKEVLRSRFKERKDAGQPRAGVDNAKTPEKHQKRGEHGKGADKKGMPEATGSGDGEKTGGTTQE